MSTSPNNKQLGLPLSREIIEAREQMEKVGVHEVAGSDHGDKLMQSWRGEGWHKTEILVGIIIGIRIAANREGK